MRRGTKRHGAGSRTLDGQQDFDRSRATKPHATSKPRGPHTWDSSYDAGALEQAVPSSLQANAQKGSGGSTDDRQSLGFLLDVALRGRGGAAHDASKQPPAGTVPSATSRVAGGEQQQQQQQEQQQQQQQAPPAGAWPFHGGAGGSSPPVVQGEAPNERLPNKIPPFDGAQAAGISAGIEGEEEEEEEEGEDYDSYDSQNESSSSYAAYMTPGVWTPSQNGIFVPVSAFHQPSGALLVHDGRLPFEREDGKTGLHRPCSGMLLHKEASLFSSLVPWP